MNRHTAYHLNCAELTKSIKKPLAMIARQTISLRDLKIRQFTDENCFSDFECGEEQIDRKIEECCNHHSIYRRRISCAFLPNNTDCCAFYCISIFAQKSSFIKSLLNSSHRDRNYIPFVYLHYIGVDQRYQNQGIGTMMMMDVMRKAKYAVNNIGVFGLALNAINDRVAGFYDNMGFKPYDERDRHPFMVLPAQTLMDLGS